MKLLYTSLLAMFFLSAWTTSQADECENRYRQLQSQHLAERHAALLKYEQAYARTNQWFKEAKRNSPSVKVMYRMRTKNDEAVTTLDKVYAERLKLMDYKHREALVRLDAACKKAKTPREKVSADVVIRPVATKKVSPKQQVEKKSVVKRTVDEVEEVRRKPKKVKKRKKKKAAELRYERTINSLIGEAEKHLKTRYKYGGNTPRQGFDCSGYVKYVYNKQGVNLPRISREQAKQGIKVKRKDAAPGDLVYFGSRKGKITHIGIVTSQPGKSLQMIHASSSKGVEIAYIDGVKYWEKRVQGFRRVLEK